MRLLGYFGWLIRGCYAVAKVLWWLLGGCYEVPRVAGVVAKVMLCSC